MRYLALPEDVIAFAWSAPMRELAARIGISDVGLKKSLQSEGIPTPPQGHWNRVHAGRHVTAPPKPEPRGPGENGRIRLDGRFRAHIAEAAPMPPNGPFASELVPADLEELRGQELRAIGRVTVPRELDRPHRGLDEVFRREAKRKEKFAASNWDWDRPKHDHPFAQRQLRLADAILKALSRRGHSGSLREEEEGFEIVARVGEAAHILAIRRFPDKRRTSISMNERQLRELLPSTPLRIELRHIWRRDVIESWEDAKGAKLELQIADIAAAVIVAAEARFRRSLAEAIEEEKRERQRQEEARRCELERLREGRMADLRSSGELLRQADEIRALVARVELAMLRDEVPAVSSERLAQWKSWALAQANELDPVISGQIMSHLHVPELDDNQARPEPDSRASAAPNAVPAK